MSADRVRIAFVHIPRTAGTTFGVALDALYEGRRIEKFYGDGDGGVANHRIDAFRALDAGEKDDVDLLRGHFVYGFDAGLRDVRHVTLLRDPVRRLISFYFYALKERGNYLHAYLKQRRMGLEQFLASDVCLDLDNYQVRAISGAQFASVREPVEQRHCDDAKRHLEREFAAFGLTEQFGRSIELFNRTFGWTLPADGHRNAGGYAADLALSDACLQRVREKNRFDIELYAFAASLFESRASGLQPAH
ncbi:sulfotransferase family 2 domain-containing protein [Burkholderia ubonensis]|uniref:IslN n=1 Tax=Burkholderia ubonensis subsp. mesacidophila TaxID=265293 RepID=A0A2A4FK29_9BURK|nr:sulfotransferase family 2 domain-containing protein [Burkholderia ubonensis]PCE33711.1 IslN [Burkholderia ubonensis subsp. mesacidophila]